MGLRVLAFVLASVAFAASLLGTLVVGGLVLARTGLFGLSTMVILLSASVVGSVIVFRGAHDWAVLRWSNEPDPFLFGRFDLDRTLRRWRRVL
jgi:hypothetical protein